MFDVGDKRRKSAHKKRQMIMATGKFSIDDAFESDDDDPIRTYGTTIERVPLRAKKYLSRIDEQTNGSRESSDGSREGLLPAAKEKARKLRAESTHSVTSTVSDSTTVSVKTFQDKRWWRHPKVRENWRVVLASFFLTLAGIALLLTGLVIELGRLETVKSFVFFIAGAICIIPGAYHVVYIYCAVKGKQGFSFYNLPVFK